MGAGGAVGGSGGVGAGLRRGRAGRNPGLAVAAVEPALSREPGRSNFAGGAARPLIEWADGVKMQRAGERMEAIRTAGRTSDPEPEAAAETNPEERTFGDGFITSGRNDNTTHFAGQDQDGVSGLSSARFRTLSTADGRWMSPDPFTGSYDITNPQSFNRYAYALNDPLSAIDPSGLSLELDCDAYGNNCTETDDGQGGGDEGGNGGGATGNTPCDPTVETCVNSGPLGDPGPSDPSTNSQVNSKGGGNAPSNAGHIAGCFAKELVAGAATAVAVGVAAAVAAPVIGATAVTVGLGALAVAGTAALVGTSGADIYNHNWGGLAYNAGTVVGGLAGGFAGGARTATAIDPNATPGYSPSSWKAQAYDPSQGSLGSWFGSGPTDASAGLANSGGGFLSSLLGERCR